MGKTKKKKKRDKNLLFLLTKTHNETRNPKLC